MRDLSTARRPALIVASPALRALPPASRHVLRGDAQVIAAAGNALGIAIGSTPCRADTQGTRAALWLGPDERLLLGPENTAADTSERVAAALQGVPHSLVDVSHRQTALELGGPHAVTILSSGCLLDLHLNAFPIGMCTRTLFGKAEIVLWRTAEQRFHIEVWRSFAAYVSGLLAEASRELALPAAG